MKSLAVVFWLLLFFVIPDHSPGMTGGISASAGQDTLDKELIRLLQSRLKNTGTAILSYALEAGELQVQVITGENVHTLYQPAGSIFFSRLLALKNSLQAKTGFDRKLAHQLYRKLIGPVKPYLKGKAHLVIIPCKNTGLIPFEALVPDTASGRYLLHDFAISYSYSLTALTGPGSRPSDYDRQKVLAVAPFNIPATQKEIMNIKADHVLGRAASLERFLEKARNYSIIHLATYAAIKDPPHSFIDFNPGKAGNVSAPEASPSGSRLFTRDIPGMDLKKVSLIVLSPCQPAQWNTNVSGLYTMAEAFARAGCPNFITSLWETEEETTHKISMKLHQYIHKGYGYAQALQKARIDYLENPVIDEKLKSPGYWAGFVLLGEINTVPQSHKIFYYFALLLTVLIVVCILRRRNHC
ncbi:CHAT domain-containing protein [Anseongella ginsenosidimutans]|uniref:CHAT domain-containing protein n=1 Tax=Anseongella ginsenosidimutans TaxID=496056 RepID=A0A4R3KP41_9SPHI|nr:CHAT domain-containing protein [Anseongella ginsenosidimutans]QEC53951.1 CHAT domain-containing protein [Anseongella ginsenosidimutans]TCS86338.1 CHAT domain-containing protein [Anseongella ginsenosidimutans]